MATSTEILHDLIFQAFKKVGDSAVEGENSDQILEDLSSSLTNAIKDFVESGTITTDSETGVGIVTFDE